MQPGAKVYRGYIYSGVANFSNLYYMTSAEVADVVVDGKQMIKIHTSLHSPDGWHATEREAKMAVRDELIDVVGKIQAVIDDLGSVLTTSEVAA